jgi:hypothetical protein
MVVAAGRLYAARCRNHPVVAGPIREGREAGRIRGDGPGVPQVPQVPRCSRWVGLGRGGLLLAADAQAAALGG